MDFARRQRGGIGSALILSWYIGCLLFAERYMRPVRAVPVGNDAPFVRLKGGVGLCLQEL